MITFLVKLSMFAGLTLAAGGMPLPGLAYGKVNIRAPGYGANLKNALKRALPFQVFLPELTTEVPRTQDVLDEVLEDRQIFPPVPEDSIERLDEEYVQILEEIEKRHRRWSSSHRDQQWHYVGIVMDEMELDQEQRAALLRAVTINPLFNKLSPTLAISPDVLSAWLEARNKFFAALRDEALSG